jgi:hypothetical protein
MNMNTKDHKLNTPWEIRTGANVMLGVPGTTIGKVTGLRGVSRFIKGQDTEAAYLLGEEGLLNKEGEFMNPLFPGEVAETLTIVSEGRFSPCELDFLSDSERVVAFVKPMKGTLVPKFKIPTDERELKSNRYAGLIFEIGRMVGKLGASAGDITEGSLARALMMTDAGKELVADHNFTRSNFVGWEGIVEWDSTLDSK